MPTNRFSLDRRRSTALLAQLLPALLAASLATAWSAATSPWHFFASGGALRLLRSRKRARHIGYTALHLVLAFQPPDPIPQYIVERVAKAQTSDQESRCYIAPS